MKVKQGKFIGPAIKQPLGSLVKETYTITRELTPFPVQHLEASKQRESRIVFQVENNFTFQHLHYQVKLETIFV